VKSIAPNNLTQITGRAIYTYDGVADYQRNELTRAGAWTTMLTGVDYTQNNVVSDDFAGFDNDATPTLFTRLKAEKASAKTVSIANSQTFLDQLAVDADDKYKAANDDEVKSKVIDELTNEDPSLIVAQFEAAELAASGDYSETNSAYVAAINTLDDYIGEILTALTERKTFRGENWLVVISSSKAGGNSGGATGSNIFEDASRNTFVAFYNPKFTSIGYIKPNVDALPYSGVSPRYSGANNNATQTDPDLANFGSDMDATIRFNIRWDYGSTYYPSFVTKRASFTGGVVGWTFFMEYGGGVGLNFSQTGQGNTQRVHPRVIADGQWHNITAKFWKNGSTRYVTLFVDGVPAPAGDLNISGLGNLNTTSPLRLGSIGDGNVNCIINDLAIYDVAIPTDVIIESSRITPLTPSNDPYHDHLIGYWKSNEGSGALLHDETENSAPFELKGSINWTSFSDISSNISPEISQSAFMAVPNGVDIPVMIYNWMNISIPKEWGLMGKFYNPIVNLPKE
jgi:NACalpha-BTF3-like transcription factor